MTAATAEAVELKTMGGNGEAVPGGDFLLELFNLAVFKFHDFAAVGANEMVVVAFMGNIVVLRLGAEMAGLRQASFAKQIERAVDRGQAQMRVLFGQLVIHLFRRDVFLLEERVENELTLASEFELMLAEVRFQRLHLFRMFRHRVPPTFLEGVH